MRLPTPGHEKTTLTTTTVPMRCGRDESVTVMTERLPLRRAWPKIDGALGQAFGAGGAHVVLPEGLQHAGTGDAGDGGDEAGGEGDGGQDQMLPGADAGRWQEPELDGKDQDQNDCEEELRRDDAEDSAHGGDGVDDGSAAQGGEDAEGQAEGNAEDDGGTSEAETVGQALEDYARGGHAVAEGVAEVELQRFLPEDDVLDDGMLVQPHLAADSPGILPGFPRDRGWGRG